MGGRRGGRGRRGAGMGLWTGLWTGLWAGLCTGLWMGLWMGLWTGVQDGQWWVRGRAAGQPTRVEASPPHNASNHPPSNSSTAIPSPLLSFFCVSARACVCVLFLRTEVSQFSVLECFYAPRKKSLTQGTLFGVWEKTMLCTRIAINWWRWMMDID